MLKLKQRGTEKTIWLVGPLVRIGSANTCDFSITGTSIEPYHCSLHINEDEVVIEVSQGAVAYLNEKQIKTKLNVEVGDVLRIVNHEFVVIDPANKEAAEPAPVQLQSSEETVFRAAPVATQESSVNQASGWLLQGLHQSLQNKRYPIEGTMVLGRTAECDLAFSYDRLSRMHAELKVVNGVLTVRDLNSSNGTYVNGEKIKQATLRHGDTLAMDKLEFTVVGPKPVNPQAVKQAQNPTVVRPPVAKPQAAKSPQAAATTPPKEDLAKANEKVAKTSVIIVAIAVVILALLAFVFLV